jgi:hypothetical protein
MRSDPFMKEHIQRASVFQNRFLGSSVHMVMRKAQEKSAKIFSRDRQEESFWQMATFTLTFPLCRR